MTSQAALLASFVVSTRKLLGAIALEEGLGRRSPETAMTIRKEGKELASLLDEYDQLALEIEREESDAGDG